MSKKKFLVSLLVVFLVVLTDFSQAKAEGFTYASIGQTIQENLKTFINGSKNVQTASTTPDLKQRLMDNFESARQAAKQKNDQLEAEIEKKKQDFEAKVETRKAALAKKFGLAKAGIIEDYFTKAYSDYEQNINKMGNSADRLEQYLGKMVADGKDVASQQLMLSDARSKIADSKTSLEDAKTKYDQAIQSKDFKTSFKDVKTVLETVKTSLKAARQSLLNLTTSIVGNSGANISQLDCGTDFNCFIKAAGTCAPAKMQNENMTDVMGTKITRDAFYTLNGMDSGKCVLYSKTLKISATYAANIPAGVAKEGEQKLKDASEGKDGTCKFNTTDLVAVLTKWQAGHFDSGVVSCQLDPASNSNVCTTKGGDFANAECTGAIFNVSNGTGL